MEDPSPAAHQELKASNSHMSLKADPSLVKFSDETLTLADALMTASQETLKQRPQLSCASIPDPQNPKESTCVGFSFYFCGSLLWSDRELIYHLSPK